MKRFHKPGDEKRSLVILGEEDYDEWLSCTNPEMARAFLQLYPAEKIWAKPAPSVPQLKPRKGKDERILSAPIQISLL